MNFPTQLMQMAQNCRPNVNFGEKKGKENHDIWTGWDTKAIA